MKLLSNRWRRHRQRLICKTVGHSRRKIEVVDDAVMLDVRYNGRPVTVVTKRHFVCSRCFDIAEPPNDI